LFVRQKKLYLVLHRFRQIDWKRGSGTVMFYICMMWIITLTGIMFIEYYHTFSSGAKTQLSADIIADGAAFAGDNGWGLDKTKAKQTANQLKKLNKKEIEDVSTSLTFSTTDGKGNVVSNKASDQNNTVNATSKLRSQTL